MDNLIIAPKDADKYLVAAQGVIRQVDPNMSSTDLRAAKADINAQITGVDNNRKALKRQFLEMFESQYADIYKTKELKELHTQVDDWFKTAKKAEDEAELAQIEEWITEENDEQVERSELPKATKYKGKSKSYVISDIQDRIDAIIYKEDEIEVAPTPPPSNSEDFNVTLTINTTDRNLAREIQGLCRKAGVRVTAKKG